MDDRSATQRILQNSNIYEHRYRLGLSQILLRSDVLIELEEQRDICLSGLINLLQHQCRRCLASRWLEKRRIQEQAIKCLQRNINVHAKLKYWPWWKLYLNVLPLLNQARSDEVQREWQEKLKKFESMNNELRLEKNRLEAQVGEMEQIYKDECQTTQHLTESLEREIETRVQLEANMRALKQKLQKQKGGFSLLLHQFFEYTKFACTMIVAFLYTTCGLSLAVACEHVRQVVKARKND